MSQNTTPATTKTGPDDPAQPAPAEAAQPHLTGPSGEDDLTGRPRLHLPSQPAARNGQPPCGSTYNARPTDAVLPNSGRCEVVCLCAGLCAINGGSDRQISLAIRFGRLSESDASRRRPPGKGGPSGIARSETAQVLTAASGRSADRSRETAMDRRPVGGRWLTCADAAGSPRLAPLRRASVGPFRFRALSQIRAERNIVSG
jgi:hypothetical protein